MMMGSRKHSNVGLPMSSSHIPHSSDFAHALSSSNPPVVSSSATSVSGAQNPYLIYQHIQDMASKRISTLDYLRKAHEGRVYWFNTLLFNKPDLQRLTYLDPKKLSRRATNFLLLGLSLPTILDLNASNVIDYLRALNALFMEFDTYQQIHPADGSSASSLSRARLPAMFKRAAHSSAALGKGRRTSSATEIGLPMGSSSISSDHDLSTMNSTTASLASSSTANTTPSIASSFPTSLMDQDLLPGEEYTYLLTPSLPFDPDFYEIFATLCDVLIDCYARVLSLVSSPAACAAGVGEMFTKVDGRIRKIIVGGVVKDFEEASRGGVKSEVAGVGRVVLGGLM